MREYEVIVTIPGRFVVSQLTHEQAIEAVDRLALILSKGIEALSGLYLRVCDTIRDNGLTDDEIRHTLSKYFPPPRVSEFIRIANAPLETYRRYRAGFIGFRAALNECRGYRILSTETLTQKKIRRAAERLVMLYPQGQLVVRGKQINVQ